MGHNDSSTYPGAVYSKVNLTDTLDVVSAINVRVAWGVLIGGAAAEIVIFRRASAGAEYFRQNVPAGAVVPIGGFRCKADANSKLGLEVITASAAGDVGVTLGYEELG